MHWTSIIMRLAAVLAVATLAAIPAGAGVVINGVPDWHQPCLINPPNGPDNGGNPGNGLACYKAWCVPTASADIMGYWKDILGFAGIADNALYNALGGNIAWNPGANPRNWQDDSADALSIPTVGGGARAVGAQDLGWYLNCNDQGDQTLPGAGGGGTFSGTKRIAVQTGLINYLTAAGYPQAQVSHQLCVHTVGWAKITAEINAGRPLLGHFTHGAMSPGAPGQWLWDANPLEDSQTGADWSESEDGNGLGHVMAIVGYYAAGDANNPFGGAGSVLDVIVAQDNRRHGAEIDNVLLQHNLPFYDTNLGQGVAPWVGYTTINIPEPGTMVLLALVGLAVFLRRRGARR